MGKKPGKKKRSWLKRLVIILLVIVILAAAGLFLLRRRMGGSGTASYASYTAATGTISNSLSFSGSLQLIDSETATANAKSTVREVYVAEGQEVTEGQKLLRLSNGQTVEASFDGRVNQLYVSAGDEVSAGASLIQVADFIHMKVAVNVDEYDIGDVKVGTACKISTTATEQQYTSEIASINYISSSGGSVAYYTATAYVEVGEGVYPGMQVTMTIPLEEAANVVVLSMDALSFDVRNQAYVLMPDASGAMQQVYVKTGVSNGNYVEITDGLQNGDVVYAISEETTSPSGFSFSFGSMGMMTNGTDRTDRTQQRQQRTQEGGSGGGSSGGFGGGGR